MESVFLPVVLRQIGRSDVELIIRNSGGNPRFWQDAKRYNQAGRTRTVIGLADLEQLPCASALFTDKLGRKSKGFHLRLAVRMLENWLLADRASLAKFLSVPIGAVPSIPDAESHAKRKIVAIARRSSNRRIKEALVPGDSGAIVGPDYVATMVEYIVNHWRATDARLLSPSLDRACMRWSAI